MRVFGEVIVIFDCQQIMFWSQTAISQEGLN